MSMREFIIFLSPLLRIRRFELKSMGRVKFFSFPIIARLSVFIYLFVSQIRT